MIFISQEAVVLCCVVCCVRSIIRIDDNSCAFGVLFSVLGSLPAVQLEVVAFACLRASAIDCSLAIALDTV